MQSLLLPCIGEQSAEAEVEVKDEYDDDEDVGYTREDIHGQESFVSRELDVSDGDGSGRGAEMYHQAVALRDQVVL